ncbi:MAG TPA: hypothetical protein VFO96_04685 [Gemmatimonadales bacterium]|jgi:hypothetical protein|nr:hypothetical protein [Gemmatimonadales bacterium]
MRRFLLAALFLVVAAAPAQAQFGLPRIKVKSPLGSSSSDVRTGRVIFGATVLEINEENVGRFLKGLAAEQDAAARLEAEQNNGAPARNQKKRDAYEKQRQAYDAASEKYDACAAPLREQGAAEMDADASSIAGDTSAMQKVAERVQAAAVAGNLTEVRRLSDSIAKASNAAASREMATAGAASKRITDKCGAAPQEPAAPEYEDEMTGEDVRAAGLTASGMTASQYSIFRERVLPYVASKGKSGGSTTYTEDEVAVLKASLESLSPYLELLQQY